MEMFSCCGAVSFGVGRGVVVAGSVAGSAVGRPRFRGLTWEGLGSCLGAKSVDEPVVIQE